MRTPTRDADYEAAHWLGAPGVPDEEYAQLACNVLTIRPGVVVMTDGNPITAQRLRVEGIEVHTYPSATINRGEGGPTCLTSPLWRE